MANVEQALALGQRLASECARQDLRLNASEPVCASTAGFMLVIVSMYAGEGINGCPIRSSQKSIFEIQPNLLEIRQPNVVKFVISGLDLRRPQG
jgi:hypothetical protein